MNLIEAMAATKIVRPSAAQQKAFSPSQPLGFAVNAGRPIRPPAENVDPMKAVVEGYKASVWVFACVFRLAQACSSIPWRVYRRQGINAKTGLYDWKPDDSDWRNELLDIPNPSIDRKELMFWTTAWLALNGNALMMKVKAGGKVDELWPLSPRNVFPVPDKKKWISGYEMTIDNARKIVKAEEVIHARLPDPSNPLWGCGMLQPAWVATQQDVDGAEWRKKMFERGGVPAGAIIDKSIASDEAMIEAERMLKLAWRNAADGGSPIILTGGEQWLPFSFNSSDLQFIEGRQFTVYEIVTAFGMLPAMFDPSAATYDNLYTSVRWMYDHGVASLMDALEGALNLALLEEGNERQELWIHYDVSGVQAYRKANEDKIEKLGLAIRSGISRDDAVTMLDLPLEPAEGGDEVFVESGLVPLKDAAETMKQMAAQGPPGAPGAPNPFGEEGDEDEAAAEDAAADPKAPLPFGKKKPQAEKPAGGEEPPAKRRAFGKTLTRAQAFQKVFNENQPRVPAGNPEGGQWAAGGEGAMNRRARQLNKFANAAGRVRGIDTKKFRALLQAAGAQPYEIDKVAGIFHRQLKHRERQYQRGEAGSEHSLDVRAREARQAARGVNVDPEEFRGMKPLGGPQRADADAVRAAEEKFRQERLAAAGARQAELQAQRDQDAVNRGAGPNDQRNQVEKDAAFAAEFAAARDLRAAAAAAHEAKHGADPNLRPGADALQDKMRQELAVAMRNARPGIDEAFLQREVEGVVNRGRDENRKRRADEQQAIRDAAEKEAKLAQGNVKQAAEKLEAAIQGGAPSLVIDRRREELQAARSEYSSKRLSKEGEYIDKMNIAEDAKEIQRNYIREQIEDGLRRIERDVKVEAVNKQNQNLPPGDYKKFLLDDSPKGLERSSGEVSGALSPRSGDELQVGKNYGYLNGPEATQAIHQSAFAEVKQLGGAKDVMGGNGINGVYAVKTETGDRIAVKGEDLIEATAKKYPSVRGGIRPLGDIERELAAQVVNEHMGGFAPLVTGALREGVDVEGKKQRAYVTQWIDSNEDLGAAFRAYERGNMPANQKQAIEAIGVFDYIIGNTDRHGRQGKYTKDGPAIFDHGLAFGENAEVVGGNKQAESYFYGKKLSDASIAAASKIASDEGWAVLKRKMIQLKPRNTSPASWEKIMRQMRERAIKVARDGKFMNTGAFF